MRLTEMQTQWLGIEQYPTFRPFAFSIYIQEFFSFQTYTETPKYKKTNGFLARSAPFIFVQRIK